MPLAPSESERRGAFHLTNRMKLEQLKIYPGLPDRLWSDGMLGGRLSEDRSIRSA